MSGLEHKVRGRAVARDRHVVDDCDPEERLDIDIVGVRLERVPEEDDEVDPTFGDRGTDLLVAAEEGPKGPQARDVSIVTSV
jgi:hypothetical protein